MRGRMYGDYDRTFREEAVKLVVKGERPLEQISIDLGVASSTLRRWYKFEMAKKGKKATKRAGPLPVSDPAAETADEKIARLERELAEVRRENASLQMDRAILKKAAAFFAKESE